MMTFYRKYRPKKIEELDLNIVKEMLMTALKSGKLAHAYLFVGPRGAGKTSAARILAKVMNCEVNKDKKEGEKLEEPCMKCEMCKSIETGSAVDVMEIDAASHRGIDAIRELREKIGLAPVIGKRKVYIIDEVHMLTTEAFNALLKTLEEPPEHASFILCTTEEHKVPETIASRCVRLSFVKAAEKEIVASLQKVVIGEGLKVEKGALELLGRSVDGSFREAHKILEQLAAIKGEIKVDTVEKFLGQSGVKVGELVKLMLLGKTKESLMEIGRMEEMGVNFVDLGLRMVDELRSEMKAELGVGEKKYNVGLTRVREVTKVVAEACEAMRTAVRVELPLELAAVDLEVNGNGNGKSEEKAMAETKIEEKIERKIETRGETVKEEKAKTGIEGKKGEDRIAVDVGKISLGEVENKWEKILEVLRPRNHSVAGLLRSTRPKAIEGRCLVLEVFYKFHKEQLEQELKRRMLEEALAEVVGPLSVKCELGKKAQEAMEKMAEHDNVMVVDEGADEALLSAASEAFGVDAH